MVAYSFRSRLNPFVLAGLGVALVAAAVLALLPGALVEALVMRSGLPAVLPAAEPPLGMTARVGIAIFGGAFFGTCAWLALTAPLTGQIAGRVRGVLPRRKPADDTVPTIRRADAHPDAPPRAPLRATRDLAMANEEMEVGEAEPDAERSEAAPAPIEMPPVAVIEDAPIERDLPEDLDTPMASLDPGALPDEPAAPPEPVASLVHARPQTYSEDERFETFEVTPQRRDSPAPEAAAPPADDAPIAAPETEATVQALLDRLERGIARRERERPRPEAANSDVADSDTDSSGGLEDALARLRQLAAAS